MTPSDLDRRAGGRWLSRPAAQSPPRGAGTHGPFTRSERLRSPGALQRRRCGSGCHPRPRRPRRTRGAPYKAAQWRNAHRPGALSAPLALFGRLPERAQPARSAATAAPARPPPGPGAGDSGKPGRAALLQQGDCCQRARQSVGGF